MKQRLILVLCVILLVACAPLSPAAQSPSTATLPSDTPEPVIHSVPTTSLPPTVAPPSPTPTPAGVTLDQLRNGTYTLLSLDNVTVKLTDGKFKYSDQSKLINAVGQLIEPAAFGDLNGDSMNDAAVTIATNTGGSGTFHELIVVLAQQGQAADLMIGDRIREKQLTIQDGKIILDYLRQGPKDGLCCPSEHAQTSYRLQNGKLEVVSDKVIP